MNVRRRLKLHQFLRRRPGGSVRPRAVGSSRRRLAVDRLSCRWPRFDFERRARQRDGRSPPRHYAPRVPSRAPFASSFDRQHTMAPPGGRPATAKGSARDKHVTFSEPPRGERGSLRRVPTGGAGTLAAASRVAAESGNAPARGARSGKNLVAPVSASVESLEVRRRRRRARAPPRDSKRPHSFRC